MIPIELLALKIVDIMNDFFEEVLMWWCGDKDYEACKPTSVATYVCSRLSTRMGP